MWMAALVAAILFTLVILISTGFGTLPSDAGYLEAVQANQLAVTGGFAVYGGQTGHGVVSPLWMLMLYGPAKAHMSLPVVMHILGILLGAFSILMLGMALRNRVSSVAGWLTISVFALSPPVLWAILAGTSAMLVLPLVAALTAIMVTPLFDDGKWQTLMLFVVVNLLVLARPEAWFLCIVIPFIPKAWSHLPALWRFVATAAGLAAGLIVRSLMLGSVDDGVLTQLFGGQGLAGVFALKELGWQEALLSFTALPLINLVESAAVAATMLIPTAAAVILGLRIIRPEGYVKTAPMAMIGWAAVIPVLLYGVFAGETGAGDGMAHMLFILPVWAIGGAFALDRIPEASIAPRAMALWIAIGSIFLVLSLAWSGQGLSEYWSAVYNQQWRQVFTLSGILLIAGVLLALAATRHKTFGIPLLAIAIVATLGLAIPTMISAANDSADWQKLDDLTESMTLLVKRHDIVGMYDSGYGLYIRPRNTLDLSGRLQDTFRESVTLYKRDPLKKYRSVSDQAIGQNAKWIICRDNASCKPLKSNSDWQFSLRSGPFTLYKYILRLKKYPENPKNKNEAVPGGRTPSGLPGMP